MTREELYATVYGNRGPVMPRPSLQGMAPGAGAPTSNASDWDMWRRDVTRNPIMQDATADDEALAWADMENRLSHDMLMRGNADRSKTNVHLMKVAQAQPGRFNLFQAPTNPLEQNVQGQVQRYVNAGQRGFQLGYASDVANRKLAQQRFENQLKRQGANLDRLKFGADQQQDARDYKAARTDAAFRQLYQKGLLTQADKRLQLQQLDNLTQGMNADGKMALEAVKDYGMDPEQAIQVFGIPEGSAADVLRAYGGLVGGQRDAQDTEDLDYAAMLNDMEMTNRRGQLPAAEHNWFSADVPDPSTLSYDDMMAQSSYIPDDATMREAMKRGFTYRPGEGFSAPNRASFRKAPTGPVRAPITSAQTSARLQGANRWPTASTPEEAMRVPSNVEWINVPGRGFARNPNFRR